MYMSQYLSLLLGASTLSLAAPSTKPVSEAVVTPSDFLISDFYCQAKDNSVVNTGISFIFTDTNSNTDVLCGSNYTTTAAAFEFRACTPSNFTDNEAFAWRYASWAAPEQFAIELAHEWSDPTDYPAPNDIVTYYAYVNVSLTCAPNPPGDMDVYYYCTLPDSPLHAVVSSITN